MHDDEDLDRSDADAVAAPVVAALRAADDQLGMNTEAAWNTLTLG